MPYRLDVRRPPDHAIDRLIELGALDVDTVDGQIAAVLPDAVGLDTVIEALGRVDMTATPAMGRDDGSVWVLRPRPVRLGPIELAPDDVPRAPGRIRLLDAAAFGTGLHPTTALCVEALAAEVSERLPARVLDVGTGSGVLALAALALGVPEATGVDIDAAALKVAEGNARLNRLERRLSLVRGGPEAVDGTWPLVVANVLAAPLIEMAPLLVRRVGHLGRLILSGIPEGVASDVERAYVRAGLRAAGVMTRAGWSALMLQTTW